MTVYYLEPSGLLKRYRAEAGSLVVHELFGGKRPQEEEFLTSHFSVVEVTAVAARMLKGRLINRSQYDGLVGRFLQDLLDYHVIVVPLEGRIMTDALDSYPDYALRAPDAIHFSTAAIASRELSPEPLYVLSADKEIGEACLRYGLGLLNPEAPSALAELAALR